MAPTSEKKQVVASHLTGQSSNHNQVRSASIFRFARKESEDLKPTAILSKSEVMLTSRVGG